MKFSVGKTLTAAIAATLAMSAMAQDKPHDPMAGAGANNPIEAEMALMDTNKDGKVSATEHAAGAQQMFKAMDANQDNRVTAEEMSATHKPWKSTDAAHHKGHAMGSADKIKVIDTNGDGVLTAQEHADGSKAMFGKMDTDKDGFLTAPEIKTGHGQMKMSKDE